MCWLKRKVPAKPSLASDDLVVLEDSVKNMDQSEMVSNIHIPNQHNFSTETARNEESPTNLKLLSSMQGRSPPTCSSCETGLVFLFFLKISRWYRLSPVIIFFVFYSESLQKWCSTLLLSNLFCCIFCWDSWIFWDSLKANCEKIHPNSPKVHDRRSSGPRQENGWVLTQCSQKKKCFGMSNCQTTELMMVVSLLLQKSVKHCLTNMANPKMETKTLYHSYMACIADHVKSCECECATRQRIGEPTWCPYPSNQAT